MYIFFMDGIALPITPSKITMKAKNKNKTYDLVSGAEVNIPAMPGLTEFSFSFTIPAAAYPFSVYGTGKSVKQQTYTDMLERLKNEQRAFEFFILRDSAKSGAAFNTMMNVTLEDYSLEEDAENGRDLVARVTLKEASAQKTKRVTIGADGSAIEVKEPSTSTSRGLPEIYIVREGDTLWEIARRCYGDGERWKDIYTRNKYVIEGAAIEAGYADSLGGTLIIPGTVIAP